MKQTNFFDATRAASYDKQNERFSAIKDNVHLLTQTVFSELPQNARILCVGAGTGSEIAFLAARFPTWHFMALDPSKPMLDLCRTKAEANGFADRCSFHEGYLDTLEVSEPYQAATSLFASQFLLDQNERRDYFHQIGIRLAPQGILVNADLSSAFHTDDYAALMENWIRLMEAAGSRVDPTVYGRDVAVLEPIEIEEIISSGGFDRPIQFFQSFLIRAWFARRSAADSIL